MAPRSARGSVSVMAAKIEPKIATIEKPVEWSVFEEAGDDVLARFREDLRDIGMNLDLFQSRVGDLLGIPFPRIALPVGKQNATPLDLEETASEYKVHVNLPGVRKELVGLKFLDQTLEIEAESKEEKEMGKNFVLRERKENKFYRRLGFPMPVAPEKADAKLDHGVLTVTVPKLKPAKEVRLRLQ
jgi:HSP20 family protein